MQAVNRKNCFVSALWQGLVILVLAAAVSLGVNQFRKDGLPLVGDWSPKAQMSEVKTVEEPVVSIEEARALFLTGGAIFLDARPADIYREGHIQGALNLPAQDMEEALPRVTAVIPPDALIIVYCDGESCTLSKEVALELTGKGYSHVRVLINGWTVWQDANLPVETG